MKYVYIVYHLNKKNDDLKEIGVFASLVGANKVIEKYRQYEGFSEQPLGFFIDRYEVNKMYWQDGYFKL